MDILVLRLKLADDHDFAQMCLFKLLERQTADEQEYRHTSHTNGIGFTKGDALALTKYAELLTPGVGMKEEYWIDLHKRMPKYAKQLFSVLTAEELR